MDVVTDFALLEAKVSAVALSASTSNYFVDSYRSISVNSTFKFCLMPCYATLYDSVICFPPLFLRTHARHRALLRFACLKDKDLCVSMFFY